MVVRALYVLAEPVVVCARRNMVEPEVHARCVFAMYYGCTALCRAMDGRASVVAVKNRCVLLLAEFPPMFGTVS